MSSFLRRLFGGSASSQSAPSSSGAESAHSAAEDAANEPSGAHDLKPAFEEPPPVDGAILHDELRETIALSMRDLDETLIEGRHRSHDVVLLMRALRDDPIGGIRELPAAAQRALSMLHGDTPMKALVEVFEKDPAMTQALLRAVNSSYYSPGGARVMSINDAINRMGRVGIQGVILEQAVSGMVSRPGGALDGMAAQVWNHMVRTAPVARDLARAFEIPPDEGFLLGLLHDVGKLVIFDRITELRGTQRRMLSIDPKVVSQTLRHLHEAVGGFVILEWNLEPDFARAVASHHREPMPPIRDRMCELIYVAERVELAQHAKAELDLEAIWNDGRLTGQRAIAEKALARES